MDGAGENAAGKNDGGGGEGIGRWPAWRRGQRKSLVLRGLGAVFWLALVAMLIVPNITMTAKKSFPFVVRGYEREVFHDTVVRYPAQFSEFGGELPQVPMAQVKLPVQERIRLARTLLMKLGFRTVPVCAKGKGAVWECFEFELAPGRSLHADLIVSTVKEEFSVGFQYDWFSFSGRGSLRQEEADAEGIMVLYARTYYALLHGGTLEKPQKTGEEGVHYCSFGLGACNDRVHLEYWIPCPKKTDSGGCDAP